MFYKGLALLALGLLIGVAGITFTVMAGGGFYWIIAALSLVVAFILSLTGYVVIKGPEAISKLADKRDELS